MRVLVLEGEPGAARDTEAALVAAGHEIGRCHDEGADVFPCNGMLGDRTCPVDNGWVDVAVVVRGEAHTDPTPGEDGVRCALRRHLPLVAVGHNEASPYLNWATAVSPGPESVADAVAYAVTAPLERHTAAAYQALREVLDTHDLPHVTGTADVQRRDDNLRVTLTTSAAVPAIVEEMAGVRAVAAIRAFDPAPRVVDVVLHQPAPST